MSLPLFVLLFFVHRFASGRLERMIVTASIAFTIAGTAGLSFKIQI